MNNFWIALIAIFIFILGFFISKMLSKNAHVNLPKWTSKDIDSTIVAIGMLIIFGGFVQEADIEDKDVFTRLVELFNGVWLLILGFLFGKMSSNGETPKKENTDGQTQ